MFEVLKNLLVNNFLNQMYHPSETPYSSYHLTQRLPYFGYEHLEKTKITGLKILFKEFKMMWSQNNLFSFKSNISEARYMLDYINGLSILSKQCSSIKLFDLFDSKMIFSDATDNGVCKTQVYGNEKVLKQAFHSISRCFEGEKSKLNIKIEEGICHILITGKRILISDSHHGQFAIEIFRSMSIPIKWSAGQIMIKMTSSEESCA